MSKAAPHNTTIDFEIDGKRPCVVKRYHRTLTAREEADAYRDVAVVTQPIPGVRVPQIYALDEATNTITLEYIPGLSLWESTVEHGLGELRRKQDLLVSLLAEARRTGTHFDSDPTNMMIDERDGGVVLIDPICVGLVQLRMDGREEPFDDYAMVVFLWGLIKMALRHRHLARPAILRCWRGYERAYIRATGIETKVLREQIARYIDIAIRWNELPQPTEGITRRMFRRTVVVPVYTVIRALFRFA